MTYSEYKPTPGVFGSTPPAAAAGPPAIPAPPTSVNPNATSTGSSPFGNQRIPDLSPGMARHVQEVLSNLIYSVPGGGYLFPGDTDANSAYIKYGGSNPLANQQAASIYGFVGQQPTVAGATPALKGLQEHQGITPTQYPSLTEMLGQPWKGPWTYPGYNPLTFGY